MAILVVKKSKKVVETKTTEEKFLETGNETSVVSTFEATIIATAPSGDFQVKGSYPEGKIPDALQVSDGVIGSEGGGLRRNQVKITKDGKISSSVMVEGKSATEVAAFLTEVSAVAAFVYSDCFTA